MNVRAVADVSVTSDSQHFTATGEQEFVSKNFSATADEKLSLQAPYIHASGIAVDIKGFTIQLQDPVGTVHIKVNTGQILLQNASILLDGKPVNIVGKPVNIVGSPEVNITGDVIKLNC